MSEQKSLIEQAKELAHRRLIHRLSMPPITDLPTQGERFEVPMLSKQDDLTEVCQIFGKPLYVRLDWRDPEIARFELKQIQSTLKDVFARAEGYSSWAAKEHDSKQGGQPHA